MADWQSIKTEYITTESKQGKVDRGTQEKCKQNTSKNLECNWLEAG